MEDRNTISEHVRQPANSTYAYIGAFVEELHRGGIQHVVVCPGSRSTPLAIAFAAQPDIHLWRHIDERSAAFFALGIAKRTCTPVALVCTSGTAAGNFLPALIEARLSRIPLLVLTADRPHELRNCGAPQSIDQIHLFGTHVKWFVDLALPEATNALLRYIRTMAGRAVSLALALPSGPVHLNFPLREPLVPETNAAWPLPPSEQRQSAAWHGRPDATPYVSVSTARLAAPPVSTITQLVQRLHTTPRGLIIVGPQDDAALADALLPLAQYLHYPILADPLSQLRCLDSDLLITSYDAFLRVKNNLCEPEFIIRFGAMPTSKPILLYLQHYMNCPQLIIDGQNGWEEPTQLAGELIYTDPVTFCQQLLATLQQHESGEENRERRHWLASWQQTDKLTQQTLLATIQNFTEPFEGRAFTELTNLLPPEATIFVGNSMPVRDLDTFFWGRQGRIRLMGNRGANGIDGLVSTALGISAVNDPDKPTVLVIGDLSFLHDLNGFLAAHLHKLHLTIILINNDGGGIFSFLPQASYPTYFEPLFGVPLGLDYQTIQQLYGWQMHRAQTWELFRMQLRKALPGKGIHIIELRTNRETNVLMHRQLWKAVEQVLSTNYSYKPTE